MRKGRYWLGTAAIAIAASAQAQPTIQIGGPNTVTVIQGSDGGRYAAYELSVHNSSATTAEVERLDVHRNDGSTLLSYAASELDGRVMRPEADAKSRHGRTVPSGARAVIHVWVSLRSIESSLVNRLTTVSSGHDTPFIAEWRLTLGNDKPLVLGLPFKTGTWLAHNGPGQHRSAHWGSVLMRNGRPTIPQRYAIDFMGLDQRGRLVAGDLKTSTDLKRSTNADWVGFGAEVLAVADGVVREMRDGQPDHAPLFEPGPPKDPSLSAVGGNYVVVELPRGQFIHYVHLQLDSVRVKPGQRVRRGEVVGHLGNSGNTNAPHLHFNVVDALRHDEAQGLPFVFEAFSSMGHTTIDQALGSPRTEPAKGVSRHDALPLDGAIVGVE
jgi:hypothetical protein